MSDYIKREDALNINFRCRVRPFESRLKTAERAVRSYADAIADLPPADVVERKPGRWVYDDECNLKCSECGEGAVRRLTINITNKSTVIDDAKTRYCLNCGARMELDNDTV